MAASLSCAKALDLCDLVSRYISFSLIGINFGLSCRQTGYGYLNNMNITVFGSGYVGLVVAACFAEVGNHVVCVDVDEAKIERLKQGKCPIYEPGLEAILSWNLKSKQITFTTDMKAGVEHGLCQFIAVGTPPDASGKADLKYVYEVAETIATHMKNYTIIIDKSTVPIGTADKVSQIVQDTLSNRNATLDFDVVSNPEFLKEGAALDDFRKPDRIILGVESKQAENHLKDLYAPFNPNNDRLIVMDRRSAELTKYASNAMLATKVSFMNEMANLAEKVGADIEHVRIGMGADPRIGYRFIYPGCGYGGSCFGKDVQALIHTAQDVAAGCDVIQAVESVNAKQKMRIVEKVIQHFGANLQDKTLALWGLSFKPETDDMRDAPSISVIDALTAKSAKIQAFDPEAMTEAKKLYDNNKNITFSQTPEEALEGADALIILTEWRVFRSPNFEKIKTALADKVIFDGRNIYEPKLMQELGFVYYGIGRGQAS